MSTAVASGVCLLFPAGGAGVPFAGTLVQSETNEPLPPDWRKGHGVSPRRGEMLIENLAAD